MFKAIIESREFEILPEGEALRINGEISATDIAEIGGGHFHVLLNNKSYRAEVVKADRTSKMFTVKINGRDYDVQLKNKSDLLLEKMGLQNGVSNKLNFVKAPMPGMIIDMKVKAGDAVRQNDVLLILEAMKMENIIKAPGDGVVRAIHAQKGTSVEKNQVIIEFE